MGLTKTELFTETQNDLAVIAKALGHPARIAILEYVIDKNACINGELVDVLGLSQPTISQHLRELKEIGIIQGTIDGVRLNYCINPYRWKEIIDKFNGIFSKYQPPDDSECC